MNWLLLQLADSAFPSGGFAHSAGYEAALQLGEGRGTQGLERFLREALWQSGYGNLILATQAHAQPEKIETIADLCDVFLSNHVANRASRTQGRTFISTCLRSFPNRGLEELYAQLEQRSANFHYAGIFGAVLKILGVGKEPLQNLLLHGTLRGIISAAIRLGTIGPYQGQQLQWKSAELLDEIIRVCGDLDLEDLAQTAPLLEILHSNHDRLYSKLFLS